VLPLRARRHLEPARRAPAERREQLKTLVTPAGREQQPVIAALFELYTYDFSGPLGLDVEADGHFEVPSLDRYWGEPGHHPFLIHVDGKLAGFALVDSVSRLTDDPNVRDVGEFFVLRKYRRRRVGEEAARFLFDAFRGLWEVRQRMENTAATDFWRAVIGRYTKGRFQEVVCEDTRWRGPVQRFDSAEV
jgi:predicted acetyltransferase